MTAIEGTLGMLSFELKNGYLPSIREKQGYKVQFCHGSPGAIPMFIVASQLFRPQRECYIRMAELCGELTWKEGLVLKGNGLCHGISGNAYLMHSLSRAFRLLAEVLSEREKAKHL
jgi:hypothetical protein